MTGPLTRKTYPLPVLPATPRAPAAGTLLILGYIRLLLGQVTPASASLFSCSAVHEPTLFVHSVFSSKQKEKSSRKARGVETLRSSYSSIGLQARTGVSIEQAMSHGMTQEPTLQWMWADTLFPALARRNPLRWSIPATFAEAASEMECEGERTRGVVLRIIPPGLDGGDHPQKY